MELAAERRRSRRYAMRFPCTVRPWTKTGAAPAAQPAQEIQAETIDISSRGFYLLLPADWLKEGKVECLIRLPAKTQDHLGVGVQCRGRIVRTEQRGSDRMGLGAVTEAYEFVHLRETATEANITPMEAS